MAINSPYVDPLIITWHTDSEGKKVSVLRENEQQKVVNGKITLSEIPDEFYGVTISGYNEVKYGKIINETDFKVNYALGEVAFHPSQEGKTIIVDSYYGRGIIYYPSSRIYYTTSPDGDVETTLQDFLDSIAAYSYKGIYDNNTIYSQNNIVYYNGTTYICEVQTTVGNPPTDETRWRPMSAGYNERGLFNELVQYYPRDIVEYDYALYVCKIKPPIGTLPTNTFYFDKLLSIENLQSLINNTKYVGEYHDDTQYYQNNIVSFNGCSYIAKKNTLGNRPPLLPLVENEYWGLIAVKGYDGANLTFKGVYREDVQYDKDDLVYYSDATVSGVFVALQSTYGNPPTNTEYWATFMLGGGDMNKAQYDYNNDGVVNDSDKLGGQLPSYYAKQEDLDNVVLNFNSHIENNSLHVPFTDIQNDAQSRVNTHANVTASLSTLGHVKYAVLTATLDTSWSGSSAPYSKTVTVSGILATDTPIIDIVMSGTYSTDEARIEAWGYIYRAVTANDSITFYATEKPTVSLPIQIKVVR